MAGKIIQVFQNTSMSNSHDGLAQIARSNGVDVRTLENGRYVVFINGRQDKLKVYAASNVVAYVRLEQGRKVDLRVIREIPRVFNGTSINYDKALEAVLNKYLAPKTETKTKVMPVGLIGKNHKHHETHDSV